MYLLFGKPRSINDLNVTLLLKPAQRSLARILVIDDQDFPFLSHLQNHNYTLSKRDDISNVTDVAEYPIILCDIRGVGKALASRFEGAHVIKEIRNHYPNKILLAYSGALSKMAYNEYLAHADLTLDKDIDLEQWIESLDHAIALAADPASAWRRMRQRLIKENVALHVVMQLEDQFVAHIQQKLPEFPSKRLSSHLPSRFRPLLGALIATLETLRKIRG